MSEDKPLSQNLQEYHNAIQSEFTQSTINTPSNEARDELQRILPDAIKALEQMLYSAESESVRASCIKLVIEYTLGKPGQVTNEDELSRLISSLTPKKDAKVPKAT